MGGLYPRGREWKWEPKDWESSIQRATIQMIRWDQTHQLSNSKKWWMNRNHNGEATLTKQNGTNNTHQIEITSNYEFLHSLQCQGRTGPYSMQRQTVASTVPLHKQAASHSQTPTTQQKPDPHTKRLKMPQITSPAVMVTETERTEKIQL